MYHTLTDGIFRTRDAWDSHRRFYTSMDGEKTVLCCFTGREIIRDLCSFCRYAIEWRLL